MIKLLTINKKQKKIISEPYLFLDRLKMFNEASAWRHDDINKNL